MNKLFRLVNTLVFLLIIESAMAFAQTITVVSPNGGETLSYGNKYTISWTSSGVTNVTIEYSVNNVNWKTIATNIPSPGNYSWTVPNTPTTQGRIRIRKNTASDVSNSVFSIKAAQFSPSDTVKILTIGNSITFDNFREEFRFAQDKISYRSFLWDSLRTNNFNIDFIGHRLGGYYQFPDANTNGVPGIRDDQMTSFLSTGYDPISQAQVTVGNYLDTYTPNIVLLHIGTNGIDDTNGTSATDIQNILNLIDSKNQNIWVVLALIIDKVPNSANVTTFNNNVLNMARSRINLGDKILIVNMQTDAGIIYTIDKSLPYSGDMYDDLHPNDSGKKKMANLWFKALKLILPVSTKSAPVINSEPDTLGYAGLPYKYDVNATGVGAPNYSLLSYPSGMTINSKTGIIDWVPVSTGSFPVSVRASNSTGQSTQNFSISVSLQPVLSNNLISYWSMDDTGTISLVKDLPGINDAVVINPITRVQGAVKSALNINTSTRIAASDDSSLYFYPGESFSIELWVKTMQSGTGDKVFLGKYGSYFRFTLGLNSSNQVKFEIKDSVGGVTSVTGSIINDGSWHHIIGMVDRQNSRLSIYVDSVRYSTAKTFHYSGFLSYDPLTFGSYNFGNQFVGQLDEIAIYNRTLSQTEISDHFIRGKLFKKNYFDQFVLANIKLSLQGFYFADGDSLSTKLRNGNDIPFTSPYAADPRTVENIPQNIVDWVLIELRTSSSLPPITSKSVFLHKNGNLVADDGITPIIPMDAPFGSYYVVIKHRNTIETWSSVQNSFNNGVMNLNFTQDSSKAFGSNLTKIGNSWAMFNGDVNQDGIIDLEDISMTDNANINYLSGYQVTDINGDSIVDVTDISLVTGNSLNFVMKAVP